MNMQFIRPLIHEIFRIKLLEFEKNLTSKEYISKQISLLDTKIRLLAFLGRKEGNLELIVEGDEEMEIKITKHSSKSIRVVLSNNLEKFKWEKT